MGVKVRLHPPELAVGTEWDDYPEATSYSVLEDNTVEIRQRTEAGKYRVIGHVHSSRWDSVRTYASHDEEADV